MYIFLGRCWHLARGHLKSSHEQIFVYNSLSLLEKGTKKVKPKNISRKQWL